MKRFLLESRINRESAVGPIWPQFGRNGAYLPGQSPLSPVIMRQGDILSTEVEFQADPLAIVRYFITRSNP
jgi:hypothetical protein